MTEQQKRNCKKHGLTSFKLKKSKKKQWYICEICLKDQWRKAQAKRRQKPEVKEYQKNFNKEKAKIIKSLSLSLRLIILADLIKPE